MIAVSPALPQNSTELFNIGLFTAQCRIEIYKCVLLACRLTLSATPREMALVCVIFLLNVPFGGRAL